MSTDTALAAPANPLAVDEGTTPTPALLLGIFGAHVAIWIGLVALVPGDDRVSFEHLGDQSTPWVRQFIIPLLVVLAFQVVVVTRLGWCKSVMRDSERTRRQWLWVVPVLLLGFGAATFASKGAQQAGAGYLVGCLATTTLVQVLFTAIIGTGIYALRRTSVVLVACMVLHGVYDYFVLQGNWDTLTTALL